MCSYNAVNGVPSCANKDIMTTKARLEWGFGGYITSDWQACWRWCVCPWQLSFVVWRWWACVPCVSVHNHLGCLEIVGVCALCVFPYSPSLRGDWSSMACTVSLRPMQIRASCPLLRSPPSGAISNVQYNHKYTNTTDMTCLDVLDAGVVHEH